jgi:hypothetical protein
MMDLASVDGKVSAARFRGHGFALPLPSSLMSAIPSLTRSHVEAAIARIDREGVPPRRESTKFHLVVDGRRYPPKYVVSLAASLTTGRELYPYEFSGGGETNSLLKSLGFTIVGPGLPTPKRAVTKPPVVEPKPMQAPTQRPEAVPVSAEAQPRSAKNGATSIVRVVVQGRPAQSPRVAGEMLHEAFENWPASGRAKFTITPGGFVVGNDTLL